MNKRIISGLAAVVLVLSGVDANVGNFVGLRTEITASADNLVYGDYTYSVLNDGTVRIMSYNGTDTELVIPDTIDGKSVTAIRNYAFSTTSTRKSLTSVIIPNSVTSIGDYAFSECKNLTRVTIGKSVKSIGNCAFWYCSLTSVTIPSSVTSISGEAFRGCSKLTTINVDNKNMSYASVNGVLYSKDISELICFPCGKASVSIPESVTSIGQSAFLGCEKLTSVTIPNSVKSIGRGAFWNCFFTNVTIGNGVKKIEDYTFYCCPNLTSVTIPNSVTSIGNSAFETCKSLTSVTIPDSVKSVDQSAFKNCPKLKSVAIPSSVTNIGYEAFGFDISSNEIPGFRIYCYKGTAGERYAKGYGLVYKLLDDNPYVTSTPGFNCATLKWNAVQGAEKYAVYGLVRGKWQKFSETVDTLYTVKNLKAGTNYEVAVIAMFSGKWKTDFSKAITVFADESAASKYPKVTDIVYNEQYHQFKLDWDAVDGAEKYGVAVFIANKWKIVTQDIPANKTNFTSPKLKAGQTYKMVVCAKVNGNWDTDNISERAIIVKVI
ncbi:leucine-rich repeat protein [Ruminococcus sp.]|uniref:leucine-rich repeat domain-containing protein n=1 Tax=Ruminococcus sp. TaxID=41978 RepID=UPI001B10538E|nr:leucine-rich repeat protein [Ruminococcus sp.]MBO5559545.1 leucine-rich repeat protein [Ruminococcus sp.]